MTLAQLFNVIKARWLLIAISIATLLVIALGYSLVTPKTYIAETSLVVNAGEPNAITGMPQTLSGQASFMGTQADIIMSRGVAAKVVDQLNLTSNPELQRAFREETGGVGSPRDWMTDRLVGSVRVKQGRDSNVLTISYASQNPAIAEKLANTFAEAYMATTVDIKAQNAAKQAIWLDKQVDAQRIQLEEAQKKLSEYQRTSGIAESKGQMDEESLQLNQLAMQLTEAQAVRSDAESRLAQMRQAIAMDTQDTIPELANNQMVQSIQSGLNAAEAKLAQESQRYGKKHPQYLAAASEVEKLRSSLRAALISAQSGVEQTAQQARLREARLVAELNKQRGQVQSLKGYRDQSDVLSQSVESAQRAYDLALQRANQMTLESRLDQSSVAILSAATAPSLPDSPKPLLYALLAVMMGGLIGIGLALLLEFKNRRVRSAFDLTEIGLPVLGEVARLDSPVSRRKVRAVQKPLLLTKQRKWSWG